MNCAFPTWESSAIQSETNDVFIEKRKESDKIGIRIPDPEKGQMFPEEWREKTAGKAPAPR